MDHRAFRELAAGAALDDLEPIEAADLTDHMAACAPCRRDASELADVAALFALAAPARRPPATLKGDVLAALAAAAAPSQPAAGVAERPVITSGAFGEPIDFAAAAAARASARSWRRPGLVGLAAAMTVAIAPDHATAALHPEPLAPHAVAYVVYRPGVSEAWLMATGVPATPAGSVYQLWAADAAGMHAGPTFTCDGTGPCLASFGMDLRGVTATMVTLESAGGAAATPGPQLVFGEL
jgi:hypothetical protein